MLSQTASAGSIASWRYETISYHCKLTTDHGCAKWTIGRLRDTLRRGTYESAILRPQSLSLKQRQMISVFYTCDNSTRDQKYDAVSTWDNLNYFQCATAAAPAAALD
ncbi:hypothetical protein EVAR_14838_1 [Eumeta japonica]|uniref:Uncharacterized protein n=1 Tax=Eumeta variegata TaxID=151549 RepID=A0A4C1V4G0_EUMVA|nr:hypothetical protein EVAR_14838_1 [Eumeta japonica]